MKIYKKTTCLSAMALLGYGTLSAQQLPLYSQYTENDFVLNPAIAGMKDYAPFRAILRDQWVGMEGNPNTQTVSMHGAVMAGKMGVGGFVFNDQIGPISKSGISASYAYHLKFGNGSKLSFGLGALLYLYQLKTNQLHFDQQNSTDNVVNTGTFKAYYPNFSFGMYYSTQKFYVGISAPELIQTKMSNSQDYSIIKVARHYYLSGGYKFNINENYTIQPSVLVKYTEAAPVEADITATFEAYKKFNIGVSYRSSAAIVVSMGYKIKEKFVIGYAYDIITTALNTYSKGSHEIMIGYNFNNKKPSNTTKPKYE
jgi:type IX secretion system PorP/SprF family membrane protein